MKAERVSNSDHRVIRPQNLSKPLVQRSIDLGVDLGGDAACWLSHVCDGCGAFIEQELPAPCWRCGEVVRPG